MRITPITQDFSYKKNNTNTTNPYKKTTQNLSYKTDSISFEANLIQKLRLMHMKFLIKKGENGHLKLLYSQEVIQKRIELLAEQINKQSQGKKVYMICVMKGASRFAKALAKSMGTKVDGKVRLKSYHGGTKSSGEILVKYEKLNGIKEADTVYVLEDIVDSGNAMKFYLGKIKKEYPDKDIKLVTLFHKPEARKPENDFKVDHSGFEISKEFILGFGLDYKEKGRKINGIYQVIKN